MSEQEAFDEQLSKVWQALSPPAGLEAKVRARLVGAGASATGTAGAASNGLSGVATRCASGALGAATGTLLLGLGFIAGYLTQPKAVETPAVPALLGSPGAASPPNALEAPAAAAPMSPPHATEVKTPPSAAAPAAVASTERDIATQAPAHPSNSKRVPPRRASEHAPRTSGAANTANGELLLLERAERAVRAHNPDLALVLAGEIEDRYPGSQLHEERRAIELMALCQAGSSLAIELGERFTRRYPGSVYGERIANECASVPTNRSALDIDGFEGGNNANPKKP